MQRMSGGGLVAAVACLAACVSATFGQDVDPALKPYERVAGEVSGSLKFVGSDTMNNLVSLWAEGFKKFYPGVSEGIEGKGSASAPPALTEGTCTFGPMSRDWKPAEIDAFKEKHGYAPTAIPAAIDMLAVFVHKDNPLAGLSLQQVDAIFSKNRNGGANADIRTWGDLGLGGEWKDKPISLYGRNASSGTYGYFKEHALFKGDFKPTVKEQPGSSAVVQAVANDKFAIGYSGIGYRTAGVRALPLAAQTGEPAVAPEPKAAYEGEYPLARFLLLSVNYKQPARSAAARVHPLRVECHRSGRREERRLSARDRAAGPRGPRPTRHRHPLTDRTRPAEPPCACPRRRHSPVGRGVAGPIHGCGPATRLPAA
jgi:phosphate transport system substrate-binding protein